MDNHKPSTSQTTMIKLGITADLSSNGSIHRQTFIRAIELAYEQLDMEQKGIELIWVNDNANAAGGKKAAQDLVAQKVEFVVGHYASGAASAAIPYYVPKQIPVFLPAATTDGLTVGAVGIFRLCGTDSALTDYIKSELCTGIPYRLYIHHDGSLHGKTLSELVQSAIKESEINSVSHLLEADQVVYVGDFTNSIHFVTENEKSLCEVSNIYFTDDVVHPELPKVLPLFHNKISVFGYAFSKYCEPAKGINQIYKEKYGEYPFTYFLETYAAMQIIDQVLKRDSSGQKLQVLYNEVFNTVLGTINFDQNGECGIRRFDRWIIEKNCLIPMGAIKSPYDRLQKITFC